MLCCMLEAGCSVQRNCFFFLVLFKAVSYAEILVLRLIQEDVTYLWVDVESKHHLRGILSLLKKAFHTFQPCLPFAGGF